MSTLQMKRFFATWEDEEDSRNEGQDGALRTNVSHVTDDEGHEDEEQRHHREGCSCPHHLCQNEKYMCMRVVCGGMDMLLWLELTFTHWGYLQCFLWWFQSLALWNTQRRHIYLSLNLKQWDKGCNERYMYEIQERQIHKWMNNCRNLMKQRRITISNKTI